MEFNDLIKNRREELGLTQKEVADYVGVSEASVSRWESKAISSMKRERLGRLAKILQLPPSALVPPEENAVPEPAITDSYVTFPIIAETAAGYDTFAEYEDYGAGDIDIPLSWLKGRPKSDYFVIKVHGDSMYPVYHDGDLVLILRQETFNYSGQVGVVVYDDNMGTLKRVEYVMGEDWMRLVPINPTYPPIMITGEKLEHCRVLGIAKMVIREVH